MQTKNKNCTSLNYSNCYKQTQKPHPNRKTFNHINGNLYHYAGNNPVRYTDPTGMWIDNEDGTYTAEKGDTLWDLYGNDWQEKSGYEGDPTKLQVGDVVGNNKNIVSFMSNELISIDLNQTNKEINLGYYSKTGNSLIGLGEILAGAGVVVGGCFAAAAVSPETMGASAMIGYDAILTGSALFAYGLTRITGANNKPFGEDIKDIFVPPIATFMCIDKEEMKK